MHAASRNGHEFSDAKSAAVVYFVVLNADLVISVDSKTLVLLLATAGDATHLIDVEVGSLSRYLTPGDNPVQNEVPRS